MMDDNKFFKFIWRVNAVVIMGAAVATGLCALVVMYFIYTETRTIDTPPPVVSAETTEEAPKENLRLRVPYSNMRAGQYYVFELQSGFNSYGKLSSGKSAQIRNLAIFNDRTNTTIWVFDSHQQEIEKYRALEFITGFDETEKHETTGYLLTVANSAPDKTITRDMWIISMDGKDKRKVLSDVERTVSIENFGRNDVRITVESQSGLKLHPIDLENLTLGEAVIITVP